MKTLFIYGKSLLQAITIFLTCSFLVDLWRSPELKPHAAFTLSDISGTSYDINTLSKNQVLLLYFWGDWCTVCRTTSPAIERLHRSGTPVISIALQSGSDNQIRDYMRKKQLSFPVVNDSDRMMNRSWNVAVTPTVIFIKNGQIIHHTTGISSTWGIYIRMTIASWFH